MDIAHVLAHEGQSMGRRVTYRNAWETTFRTSSGEERTLTIIVYDCDPIVIGGITVDETRFGVWVDGTQRTGGWI